jgi:hypothetical protein
MRSYWLPTDWDIRSSGMFNSKLQLSFSSCLWARQLSRDVPADAGVLCDKADVIWDNKMDTVPPAFPTRLANTLSWRIFFRPDQTCDCSTAASYLILVNSQSTWIGAVNTIGLNVGAHVPRHPVRQTLLTLISAFDVAWRGWCIRQTRRHGMNSYGASCTVPLLTQNDHETLRTAARALFKTSWHVHSQCRSFRTTSRLQYVTTSR